MSNRDFASVIEMNLLVSGNSLLSFPALIDNQVSVKELFFVYIAGEKVEWDTLKIFYSHQLGDQDHKVKYYIRPKRKSCRIGRLGDLKFSPYGMIKTTKCLGLNSLPSCHLCVILYQ